MSEPTMPPPVCAAPCPYGGRSMMRKWSRSDLGMWNYCNRRVRKQGDRCWQHATPGPEDTSSERGSRG